MRLNLACLTQPKSPMQEDVAMSASPSTVMNTYSASHAGGGRRPERQASGSHADGRTASRSSASASSRVDAAGASGNNIFSAAPVAAARWGYGYGFGHPVPPSGARPLHRSKSSGRAPSASLADKIRHMGDILRNLDDSWIANKEWLGAAPAPSSAASERSAVIRSHFDVLARGMRTSADYSTGVAAAAAMARPDSSSALLSPRSAAGGAQLMHGMRSCVDKLNRLAKPSDCPFQEGEPYIPPRAAEEEEEEERKTCRRRGRDRESKGVAVARKKKSALAYLATVKAARMLKKIQAKILQETLDRAQTTVHQVEQHAGDLARIKDFLKSQQTAFEEVVKTQLKEVLPSTSGSEAASVGTSEKSLQKSIADSHAALREECHGQRTALDKVQSLCSEHSVEIQLCWSTINQLCSDNETFRDELRQFKSLFQGLQQQPPDGAPTQQNQDVFKDKGAATRIIPIGGGGGGYPSKGGSNPDAVACTPTSNHVVPNRISYGEVLPQCVAGSPWPPVFPRFSPHFDTRNTMMPLPTPPPTSSFSAPPPTYAASGLYGGQELSPGFPCYSGQARSNSSTFQQFPLNRATEPQGN